jgi:hypothetical protein
MIDQYTCSLIVGNSLLSASLRQEITERTDGIPRRVKFRPERY